MFLLGLRNYGPNYVHTVHNLGEEFILQIGNIINKIFYSYILSIQEINRELYCQYTYLFKNGAILHTILLKSFMNTSSNTLGLCTDLISEIKSSSLVIVYDDILLPTAHIKASKLKLNTKHNGVLSMINYKIVDILYTIRIGATKPENMITKDFVLSKLNINEYQNSMYQFIVYMFDYITNLTDKLDANNLIKHLQTYKTSLII